MVKNMNWQFIEERKVPRKYEEKGPSFPAKENEWDSFLNLSNWQRYNSAGKDEVRYRHFYVPAVGV